MNLKNSVNWGSKIRFINTRKIHSEISSFIWNVCDDANFKDSDRLLFDKF